jgi:hypothetical protein
MEVEDGEVAACIRTMLAARDAAASIRPSDVARELVTADKPGWRSLMPTVRSIASALAHQGIVRITRGTDTLDPNNLEGGRYEYGGVPASCPSNSSERSMHWVSRHRGLSVLAWVSRNLNL